MKYLLTIAVLFSLFSPKISAAASTKNPYSTYGVYESVYFAGISNCSEIFSQFFASKLVPMDQLPIILTGYFYCIPSNKSSALLVPRMFYTTSTAGDSASLTEARRILHEPMFGVVIQDKPMLGITSIVDFNFWDRDTDQGDREVAYYRGRSKKSEFRDVYNTALRNFPYLNSPDPNTFKKSQEFWLGSNVANAIEKDIYPATNYVNIRYRSNVLFQDGVLDASLGFPSLTINRNCATTANGKCDMPLPESKTSSLYCPPVKAPDGAWTLTRCYEVPSDPDEPAVAASFVMTAPNNSRTFLTTPSVKTKGR